MPPSSRKPDYSGKKRSTSQRGGDARKKRGAYGESADKRAFNPENKDSRAPRGDKKPFFKKDNREEGGFERKKFQGGSDERRSQGDASERKPFRSDDSKRGPRGDKPGYKKPYFKKDNREEGGFERKKFGDREDGPRKTFGDATGRRTPGSEDRKREPRGDKPFKKPYFKKDDREEGGRKSFGDSSERKPFNPEERPRRESRGDKPFKKPYFKKDDREERRPSGEFRGGEGESRTSEEGATERKSFDRPERRAPRGDKPFKKPYFKKERDGERGSERKSFRGREEGGKQEGERKPYEPKPFRAKKSFASPSPASADGLIRLNKYIANAGICSRREADKLIETGVISVNGKVVTELGFKISPTDVINFGGQTLKQEKMIYILLNKPKDYITTLDDPEGRKTVLELIRNAGRERVYPVGRLDRNTTGLLLLTNDGDLTKKLTHPRYGVRKIYQVTLDKALTKGDMQKIADGVELEDGLIRADDISYVGDGKEKNEIGIQLHSGRNRIVRRLFEHLGYDVVKLDRVYFAGLTKKDLPRGRWRILTPMEISMLKMVPSGEGA